MTPSTPFKPFTPFDTVAPFTVPVQPERRHLAAVSTAKAFEPVPMPRPEPSAKVKLAQEAAQGDTRAMKELPA